MAALMRTTPARRGAWLLCAVAVAVTGLSCNWLTGTRTPDKPKQGLIVHVDRHRAALFINDEAVTLLSGRERNVIGLAPGRYRVAIKKSGYFSRYYDVQVRRNTFARLRVRLPPELD